MSEIITETTAPSGYATLNYPIDFVFDASSSWSDSKALNAQYDDVKLSYNFTNKLLTVTIKNITELEVPSTGGVGKHIPVTIGFSLMIAAAAWYVTKVRKD